MHNASHAFQLSWDATASRLQASELFPGPRPGLKQPGPLPFGEVRTEQAAKVRQLGAFQSQGP